MDSRSQLTLACGAFLSKSWEIPEVPRGSTPISSNVAAMAAVSNGSARLANMVLLDAPPPQTPLVEITQQAIRDSPDRAITLAQFMALALYHPDHGYYQRQHAGPGRSGDFLTSPEASPYFGLTVARQLVEVWDRLGQPAVWEIREYGAGTGVLAYDILAGVAHDAPEALAGLRYRLVETNPYRRQEALAAMTEAGLADRKSVV